MKMSNINLNALAISKELDWFSAILHERIQAYFEQKKPIEINMPDLSADGSTYAKLIKNYQFKSDERMIMMLALSPHIKPELLDIFYTKNSALDRAFTEFGGYQGKHHRGFLPTGETAIFLLSLGNLEKRLLVQKYFEEKHPFNQAKLIWIEGSENDEPRFSGPLIMSGSLIQSLTSCSA